MKTKFLLFLLLLSFYFTAYAQKENNHELLKILDQDIYLESANQNIESAESNEYQRPFLKTNISIDTDLDGMPNDWEMENGLDPNNPKDAFQDKDQDWVINLFEFQMNSNPNKSQCTYF